MLANSDSSEQGFSANGASKYLSKGVVPVLPPLLEAKTLQWHLFSCISI